MLFDIFSFLLDIVVGLVAGACLLRMYMQAQRVPFGNPVGQLVFALSDWIVLPLRKVLPGKGRWDMSCLLAAFALQLLEVLLIWLVRCTTLSLQVEETPRSDSRECVEIKRYLDSNFREDISLDRLAEIAHLNKYYLAHTFQKEYGVSPITYLNRRRIEESKYMLGNTGYSLAQISELMGFSSPSYFSQCFRKSEGLTPNEYRRQARQGKRPAPAKRHEG